MTKAKTVKSQAETQKAWRERMKESGFVHFQAWVHVHQKEAIEAYLNVDNQAIESNAVKLLDSTKRG